MIRLRRVQFPVAGVYEAILTLDGENIAARARWLIGPLRKSP